MGMTILDHGLTEIAILNFLASQQQEFADEPQIVHFAAINSMLAERHKGARLKTFGFVSNNLPGLDVLFFNQSQQLKQLTQYAENYLDSMAPQWIKGHGSFGKFTFNAAARTIKLELNLLGVIQASSCYLIEHEKTQEQLA
jgi:hypothetical protein